MTDVTMNRSADDPELSAADEQLPRELTERARAGGLKLTGEGGLLGKQAKMVVEGAVDGELDDDLGYSKHESRGYASTGGVVSYRSLVTEGGGVGMVTSDPEKSAKIKRYWSERANATPASSVQATTYDVFLREHEIAALKEEQCLKPVDLPGRARAKEGVPSR